MDNINLDFEQIKTSIYFNICRLASFYIHLLLHYHSVAWTYIRLHVNMYTCMYK